jgi:hypothetical protein
MENKTKYYLRPGPRAPKKTGSFGVSEAISYEGEGVVKEDQEDHKRGNQ